HSVRIDSQNKSMITNSETHKTIEVDHLHKTYSVTGEDPAQTASSIMKLMNAKVTAKVTPTDEHSQIAGLDATKYLADFNFDLQVPQAGDGTMHLKIHMESWTTTQLAVNAEGGAIVDSPNDMIRSLISLATISQVKDELMKIKGF